MVSPRYRYYDIGGNTTSFARFSPLVASFLAFLLARRGHEEIGPGCEDGVADAGGAEALARFFPRALRILQDEEGE